MKRKELDQTSFIYLAAGLAITALMTLFGIGAFLGVNSIVVEGIVLYSPQQVAEASGISASSNLLYLREQKVRQNITGQLPYIDSVKVSRSFPDTLIIEVTERTAVAYIPFAGNAVIIDSGGKVLDIFRLSPGMPVEVNGRLLIEIRGIPVSEAVLGSEPVIEQGYATNYQPMKDILRVMERENIVQEVNYLDIANITNISFGFMNLYRVILGGLRDHAQKIQRLPAGVAYIQEMFPPNTRGVYNMTNPSGEFVFSPD